MFCHFLLKVGPHSVVSFLRYALKCKTRSETHFCLCFALIFTIPGTTGVNMHYFLSQDYITKKVPGFCVFLVKWSRINVSRMYQNIMCIWSCFKNSSLYLPACYGAHSIPLHLYTDSNEKYITSDLLTNRFLILHIFGCFIHYHSSIFSVLYLYVSYV